MGKYDDIIGLPHYRSPFRTPMAIENRAAQFAPFAALSGHEEAIFECSRITESRTELTNEEKIEISKKISEAYSNQSAVKITYFIADKTKDGGTYSTAAGLISKLDETNGFIVIDHRVTILMEDISTICRLPRQK